MGGHHELQQFWCRRASRAYSMSLPVGHVTDGLSTRFCSYYNALSACLFDVLLPPIPGGGSWAMYGTCHFEIHAQNQTSLILPNNDGQQRFLCEKNSFEFCIYVSWCGSSCLRRHFISNVDRIWIFSFCIGSKFRNRTLYSNTWERPCRDLYSLKLVFETDTPAVPYLIHPRQLPLLLWFFDKCSLCNCHPYNYTVA